jgi:polyferredoxin
MVHQLPRRQRVRKALLIVSFLLFPVTMNYLSPYVIIASASIGVVNASLIAFALMLVGSLFLGRLWCGWVCPGGAMQEIVEPVNRKQLNPAKLSWVKWVIWIPWVGIIAYTAISAGGYRQVNPLFLTETGISVDEPMKYIVYYLVVGMFFLLPVLFGRRVACYTICWMAPFMMIGRWIRNRFGWPALQLEANAAACTSCKTCTQHCPMSLDVAAMVKRQNMEHPECILCGTCVDGCPRKVIRYAVAPQRRSQRVA